MTSLPLSISPYAVRKISNIILLVVQYFHHSVQEDKSNGTCCCLCVCLISRLTVHTHCNLFSTHTFCTISPIVQYRELTPHQLQMYKDEAEAEVVKFKELYGEDAMKTTRKKKAKKHQLVNKLILSNLNL